MSAAQPPAWCAAGRSQNPACARVRHHSPALNIQQPEGSPCPSAAGCSQATQLGSLGARPGNGGAGVPRRVGLAAHWDPSPPLSSPLPAWPGAGLICKESRVPRVPPSRPADRTTLQPATIPALWHFGWLKKDSAISSEAICPEASPSHTGLGPVLGAWSHTR